MSDSIMSALEDYLHINQLSYFERIKLFYDFGTYQILIQVVLILIGLLVYMFITDYQKNQISKKRSISRLAIFICIFYFIFSGITKLESNKLEKSFTEFKKSSTLNEKIRIINSTPFLDKPLRNTMYEDYQLLIKDNFKSVKITDFEEISKNYYKISFEKPLSSNKSSIKIHSTIIADYYSDLVKNQKQKSLFFSYTFAKESVPNLVSKGEILNYKIVEVYY